MTRVQHFGEDGYHVQISLDKLDDKVRHSNRSAQLGSEYLSSACEKQIKSEKPRFSNFLSGARTLWQLPCRHYLQGPVERKTRKGAPKWRECRGHD